MQLREIIPNESIWYKIEMICDICKKQYTSRVGTVVKHTALGSHKCKNCISSINGKKNAENLEFGKKISASKKGVKFTAERLFMNL